MKPHLFVFLGIVAGFLFLAFGPPLGASVETKTTITVYIVGDELAVTPVGESINEEESVDECVVPEAAEATEDAEGPDEWVGTPEATLPTEQRESYRCITKDGVREIFNYGGDGGYLLVQSEKGQKMTIEATPRTEQAGQHPLIIRVRDMYCAYDSLTFVGERNEELLVDTQGGTNKDIAVKVIWEDLVENETQDP